MNESRVDNLLRTAFRAGEVMPRSWENRASALMSEQLKGPETSTVSNVPGRGRRPRRLAIVFFVLLLTMPVAVYAGFRLLSAGETALLMDKTALAEAFDCKEKSIVTKTDGAFTISLLGLVSGEFADAYFAGDADTTEDTRAEEKINEEINTSSSYVAVAIQRVDGRSIENYDEAEFYVSPLIEGLDPKVWNIAAFENGTSKILKDGVLYIIAEWDDFEIFADRKLYVAVIEDAVAPMPDSVRYDEETGKITLNPQYDKTSALFEMNIDANQTDPAAAREKLAQIRGTAEPEAARTCDSNIQRVEESGITFMTQNGHASGDQWRLSLFVQGDDIQKIIVQSDDAKLAQPELLDKAEYDRISQVMEDQRVSVTGVRGVRLQATQGLYLLIDPARAKQKLQVDWTRFSDKLWSEEALVVFQDPKKAAGTEFEIVVTKKDGSMVSKTIKCRGLTGDGISAICEFV